MQQYVLTSLNEDHEISIWVQRKLSASTFQRQFYIINFTELSYLMGLVVNIFTLLQTNWFNQFYRFLLGIWKLRENKIKSTKKLWQFKCIDYDIQKIINDRFNNQINTVFTSLVHIFMHFYYFTYGDFKLRTCIV